jgi:uncharacterized protein (DUF2252 family)
MRRFTMLAWVVLIGIGATWIGVVLSHGVSPTAAAPRPVARKAPPTAPAEQRAAAVDEKAFDVLQKNYAKYCEPGDDLAFPMKVWGLATGPKYKFWRGSRDLYFAWLKEHAKDWLGDRGSYVLNHGDLHLGNIGSYVREGPLGATSFGPVDFDETARLPFQAELLQGLISMRLAATDNEIDLGGGGKRDELTRTLFDAYREGVASEKSTRELVSTEQQISKFIEQSQKHAYDTTLGKFAVDGAFRRIVHNAKGDVVKEILRPAKDRTDDLARGIAQALQNSKVARDAFRYSDVDTIRKSIRDVALRTRLESVGSQGLKKYLVLMERPLKGLDMDVVLYIKQEIPSAAERAGAIPMDPRSPGRRCSEDMEALTNPTAYLNTWCDIGKESYWVSFKEPWSEEIDVARIGGWKDLQASARVWGKVAGAMHRLNGDPKEILKRLDGQAFYDQLRTRTYQYLTELERQHKEFADDARVRADVTRAQKAIDAAAGPRAGQKP